MICAHCGQELIEHARFCKNCGTPVPVPKICIACGRSLPPNALFCQDCGSPQQSAPPQQFAPPPQQFTPPQYTVSPPVKVKRYVPLRILLVLLCLALLLLAWKIPGNIKQARQGIDAGTPLPSLQLTKPTEAPADPQEAAALAEEYARIDAKYAANPQPDETAQYPEAARIHDNSLQAMEDHLFPDGFAEAEKGEAP